ncbi:MAG: hypothetical protein CFH44_00089 [Proteobacteria bacterium]|nr:MAG: hypothetical protein CFH44_00089 [Pseudomonadota bacterium]|tara:strand:- start:1819 stop:2406 length:588 start_codon:yes stop_codon:yes gene_type:complete
MLNKKGAMFGLDARIALAIFGALSVISGAALYNAIQNVKSAQYWQTFKAIHDASEHYYLENGKPLPIYSGVTLYGSDLVQNRESLSTWNGPYLSNIENSNDYYFQIKDFPSEDSAIVLVTKSDSTLSNCSSASLNCAEYVRVNFSGDSLSLGKDMFSKLDNYIDNNDGAINGKIRLIKVTDKDYLYVMGRQRTLP